MILETELIYVDNGMILTIVLTCILFWIFILSMEIFSRFREKVHKSYHKGYNQAKDDKIEYYSTINSLKQDFDKIISNFKIDNLKPSIITTNMLLKYRDSLNEYYDN